MIELRWKDKLQMLSKDTAKQVRVLQYRHWIAYAAANGNAMFPLEPQWSDWLEVPNSRDAAPQESPKEG